MGKNETVEGVEEFRRETYLWLDTLSVGRIATHFIWAGPSRSILYDYILRQPEVRRWAIKEYIKPYLQPEQITKLEDFHKV